MNVILSNMVCTFDNEDLQYCHECDSFKRCVLALTSQLLAWF